MKTILTHFYNEEYLLPWWLEHHKKIFDFGVLIDYHSTDRSVEIIKDICPNWQIFTSRNNFFDAYECDSEIMFYEHQLPGYRIVLTVTEFLLGDIDKITPDRPDLLLQWFIPSIKFSKWDPSGRLDTTRQLWQQIHTGKSYRSFPELPMCRSYHNFIWKYWPPGRHYLTPNTEECIIFNYANSIIGAPMVKRRLQIQHKISEANKKDKLGDEHYIDENGMTFEKLEEWHKRMYTQHEEDLSQVINDITKINYYK